MAFYHGALRRIAGRLHDQRTPQEQSAPPPGGGAAEAGASVTALVLRADQDNAEYIRRRCSASCARDGHAGLGTTTPQPRGVGRSAAETSVSRHTTPSLRHLDDAAPRIDHQLVPRCIRDVKPVLTVGEAQDRSSQLLLAAAGAVRAPGRGAVLQATEDIAVDLAARSRRMDSCFERVSLRNAGQAGAVT
jgi:hypothetical protein